jgi:hypothetical protein
MKILINNCFIIDISIFIYKKLKGISYFWIQYQKDEMKK